MPDLQSWGRYPVPRHRASARPADVAALADVLATATGPLLAFGNGRSYGDCCLNNGGMLVDCRSLNRVLAYDGVGGTIRCEAGMLLADIVQLVLPDGWFLPVTPGTQFVTLGGAIANDVHGKNHHVRGTFGRHVRAFELMRSDGMRRICSGEQDAEMFGATIGGMGLTGVITWAEIALLPVPGDAVAEECRPFAGIDEFLALSAGANGQEYSVAWLDTLAEGPKFARGLFLTGSHAGDRPSRDAKLPRPRVSVPLTPTLSLLNRASLKAFNTVFYESRRRRPPSRLVPFRSFFYPLDGVAHWNRLYGAQGLFQHQSIVPLAGARDVLTDMLQRTQRSGLASFLTVLKVFGDIRSPGLMSFPKPGVTLTLDFANKGTPTLALLKSLDEVVIGAGGRVNPYKDARMSPATFAASYPHWRELRPFIDPKFSSSLWRRLTTPGPSTGEAGS